MWFTIVSLPFLLISGFVANNTSFPKPLSSEDEDRYLRLYSMGDEKAKNILIEKNLRLVAHVVKKYHNTGYNADDLISIGTIGLIKAITTFDTSKGTRLATYAARCIENEILMTIRAGKKTKNEVSIQEPIGIDKEGNELPLTVYRQGFLVTSSKVQVASVRVCLMSLMERRRYDSFLALIFLRNFEKLI